MPTNHVPTIRTNLQPQFILLPDWANDVDFIEITSKYF